MRPASGSAPSAPAPRRKRIDFHGRDLIGWREDTEIAEVQRFQIGITPLPDGPFERGKSGFKLIQYTACGLPVMAPPVGVNASIVDRPARQKNDKEWRP